MTTTLRQYFSRPFGEWVMSSARLSDVLPRLCYDAGLLVSVEHATATGLTSPCAVRLTFESLAVVFRANPDDDTISASVGGDFPEPDEELFVATDAAPWSAFVGRRVGWAWRLTNQQGYEDGVRLEFQDWAAGVELVVGGGIHLFTYTAAA